MNNKRETKATVLIKHHLKQLRLPTMVQTIARRLRQLPITGLTPMTHG